MSIVEKSRSDATRRRATSCKESGAEWIGRIPSHWSMRRLKYVARLRNEKDAGTRTDGDFRIALENVESWTGRLIETEAEFEGDGIQFRSGDVLFGKLRPYLAKVWQADREGAAVGEFFVLAPTGICDSRFLYYRLVSKPFVDVVDGSTYGTKMPRAGWDWVGNLSFAVPPLAEQRAIAAFLDRETAKIDTLVEKKERLIALLAEKRTALISHVVTKGLDRSAPMKDSGVQWLGQIPAHWTIHHLRRVVDKFVDYRGRTPTKTDSGIPLITAGAIKDGFIDHSLAPEFMSADDYDGWMSRGRPSIGDIVVTTEAPLAEVAQVDNPHVALAQRVILFKVNPKRLHSGFLRYYYLSVAGKAELHSRASGSTASGIRADRLRASLVLIPPLDEQRRLTEFLDARVNDLGKPAGKIRMAIERLHEYRAALISAAVTGKIDVRGEV